MKTILKTIGWLLFAPCFAFYVMPTVGIMAQLWGYPETAETVLRAFFDILAYSGGLS